jgi:hypothetical protein
VLVFVPAVFDLQDYSSNYWGTTASWISKDSLTADVVAEMQAGGEFFWTSHTFTHQNLNNVTNSDATYQW